MNYDHGGNTNFPTCGVVGVDQLPYMQKLVVDRANQKVYQLGRQETTIVPFAVIARSKAVILDRQPVYILHTGRNTALPPH